MVGAFMIFRFFDSEATMDTGRTKTQQAVEEINRQQIPVGSLDEFSQAVYKEKLTNGAGQLPGRPGEPWLGVEKFKTAGGKFYRLIWLGLGKAWLAGEVTERFKTKSAAVMAGDILAGRLGARFSEATR